MIWLTMQCPFGCGTELTMDQSDKELHCQVCDRRFSLLPVPDFLAPSEFSQQTSGHYTMQWGNGLGLNQFMASQASKPHTAASQLPWAELFEQIRGQAQNREIIVYDAACGWGSIFRDLFADPIPSGLRYLGADIHGSLGDIEPPPGLSPEQYQFIRWDISQPPPTPQLFDYVLCRASMHHTPNPQHTLTSLAKCLLVGGVLAISLYARKAPMREALDDAFRAKITPLPPQEAWDLCRQFAVLGKDLQEVKEKFTISEDLPFLGIKAGEYGVHEFIYDHVLKCWYNSAFGMEHSTSVNFDWYHPEFAYRYTPEEISSMAAGVGLVVHKIASSKYQHYLEAEKK
jgi:SAM-dependent methyltransferase